MFQMKAKDKTWGWGGTVKLIEMKISNLPDKELKVIFIKIHTELEQRMDKHKWQRDGKYKKVPNGSDRAEEYNNWTENYTKGVQQQTRSNRRKECQTQIENVMQYINH